MSTTHIKPALQGSLFVGENTFSSDWTLLRFMSRDWDQIEINRNSIAISDDSVSFNCPALLSLWIVSLSANLDTFADVIIIDVERGRQWLKWFPFSHFKRSLIITSCVRETPALISCLWKRNNCVKVALSLTGIVFLCHLSHTQTLWYPKSRERVCVSIRETIRESVMLMTIIIFSRREHSQEEVFVLNCLFRTMFSQLVWCWIMRVSYPAVDSLAKKRWSRVNLFFLQFCIQLSFGLLSWVLKESHCLLSESVFSLKRLFCETCWTT